MTPKFKRNTPIGGALFVAVTILTGVYWIALQYGLWLPDTILPKRTLAQERTKDGHRFRVVQYVGDLEWYTTELIHTFPSGKSETRLLAFEDNFAWRVPMTVSLNPRHVVVQTGEGHWRSVSW